MERINKIINGFNPEIGLLYTHWMNDYKFNIGLNIKPEAQIRSKKNILHSTYSGPIYNPDTDYVIFEEEFFNDMITLPFESSLGLSVEFNEQWLIGLDYNHINWINYSDNGQNTSYITNKNEFILGGEFTPKKEDIYNYFNRVKYRFGVGYSSGYLDLSNMTNLDQPEMMLQEISCNIGLGLPINKVVSMAHIGLRWSMRGYNLSDPFIKENHLSFYLSMTLNEKWFNKRKIE